MWDFFFLSYLVGRGIKQCAGDILKTFFKAFYKVKHPKEKKKKKKWRHSLLCRVSGRLTLNSD